MKTERELFQAWYEDAYHEISQMLPSGQYASLRQQHSWGAWQASAQREGYAVVNKKKLAKVLNCVTDEWLIDTGAMNEFKEIELLVTDEVEAMIGAAE